MARRKKDLFGDVDRAWVENLPHALSSTERARRFRGRGRDIGSVPRPRHRRVRARAAKSLLYFALHYCVGTYEGMPALLKRPPSPRMLKFVEALEDKILHGGLKHVRWPRGKGKSTWVKVAILWSVLFGYKRFVVVVEKTKGMSRVVVEEIWKRIYTSPRMARDFPEFSIAMRDVELSPQRMRAQTYAGKPTYMRQDISSFCYYKLPTLEGFANTGGIIAYRGADQALRGINIESQRPDFFFIDDPQDENDAQNPATVAKIEKNINGAVLGSGEIDHTISAVMASTPIEPDDVSQLFADRERHPEWQTETERLVVSFGPKDAMASYLRAFRADESTAHAYYLAHRAEIEDGVEMMDDGDFDKSRECSAYEHALNLLATRHETSFFAEYQMTPSKMQGVYKITAKAVRERVNGVPYAVVPAACDQGVLAFVDINATAGLRWELCAFGHGRVTAILAYGQYPKPGERFYPEGLATSLIPRYLAPAMRVVADTILSVDLKSETGDTERVRGICFDGGWQTECVAATIAQIEAGHPSAAFAWSKGYDSKGYSRYHHEKAASGTIPGCKAGEECHTWVTANGAYLAINSDYWKEVMQTSFLAEPLTGGSSSFYGDDPLVHMDFAQEIVNEELKAKESSTKYGTIYTWSKASGCPNHYGDVHAGALAFGSIRGNFDSVATVISTEKLKVVARARKVRYVYRG